MTEQQPGPLLAFKAGRAFRREGTNFVDHNPTKGAIYLYKEDGLLHLQWKTRPNNTVEEDLILLPEDASFIKVESSSWGRTYVLKFSSSNQRHFFWMQDASDARDDDFVRNLNGYLRDVDYEPLWQAMTTPSTSQSQVQAASSSTPGSTTNTSTSTGGNYQPTAEDLAQLRSLVTAMADTTQSSVQSEVSLNDVLTVENLSSLLSSHPEVAEILFPHLPSDLPTTSSPEVLQHIVASPQFQSAVRNFDQALQTGLLGGLVRSLGLPDEAGTGVEPFLRAVQDQAQSQKDGNSDGDSRDDTMDTN